MLYEGGCGPQEARDRLGAFGFSGEDAFKWVSDLSGGELSRLRLCILMKEDVNFLILDEPTNHLDILSREWIDDALEDYGEALLLVSHDRYFIRRFATRIWELRDGELLDYRCGYDEYRARREREEQVNRAEKKQENREKPKKKAAGPSPERRRALLEKRIQEAEERLSALDAQIEENATDYARLEELFREKGELEKQVEDLYLQWDAVE
jgi:ATPase subunit of ABC transporter with duplicated ATPase domains